MTDIESYQSDRDNFIRKLAVVEYRIKTLYETWKNETDDEIKTKLRLNGKELETEQKNLATELKQHENSKPINFDDRDITIAHLQDDIYDWYNKDYKLRRDIQLLEFNIRRRDETILELRDKLKKYEDKPDNVVRSSVI